MNTKTGTDSIGLTLCSLGAEFGAFFAPNADEGPAVPVAESCNELWIHHYKRNGTATLFAALDALQGQVISMCDDRHRHLEWLKFLRGIDYVVPDDKQVHMIVDNYATHKHPKVQRWLARHPRFHMHFTPTGCSWLNMVERFFRDLTENRLRRGVFRSVEDLIAAIDDYIGQHNEKPKPFIWTNKAADTWLLVHLSCCCPSKPPVIGSHGNDLFKRSYNAILNMSTHRLVRSYRIRSGYGSHKPGVKASRE